MADFKAHITSGVVVGGGVGVAGLVHYGLRLPEAFSLAIIAMAGSLLPDIDSDTGRSLELLFDGLSILIPTLLLPMVFHLIGRRSPDLLCYFVLMFLMIRLGLFTLVKRLTVHRGILHSIPFTLLAAESVYLLFAGEGRLYALLAALSMGMGCLTHLVIDEVNAVSYRFGFPIFNRSSGSALAFFSSSLSATLVVYLLVIVLGWCIWSGVSAMDLLLQKCPHFFII